MGDINFNLRPVQAKTGKALIQLTFRYNGQRLRWSWGDAIDPKKWNTEKQRIKSSKETDESGEYFINDLLDSFEKVLLKSYQNEKAKGGIPTETTLKKVLKDFHDRSLNKAKEDISKPNFFSLLELFIKGEKSSDGEALKKSTIKSYKTALLHLTQFQSEMKYPIDFETINTDFFDKLLFYLKKVRVHKFNKSKGIDSNAIAKTVSIVKIVMHKAMALKYTKNDDFKLFKVKTKAAENTYLTTDEIIKLYKHDFSDNKRLERVRDLFVFGCFVGLRFSDFSDIKPENIVKTKNGLYIHVIQKKTGNEVIIPCHPLVLVIFRKYENDPNNLPKSPSNQKFNEYIKEACKAAGMTEKGRLISKPDKQLFECIYSHTARRSFATNTYLEGFSTIDLMRITGHLTETSFLKYIKVSKQQSADRLNTHMKNNWSEKMLKVA